MVYDTIERSVGLYNVEVSGWHEEICWYQGTHGFWYDPNSFALYRSPSNRGKDIDA